MPQFTIVVASVLILLGLGGYFGTGRVSVTALIPVLFGLPIALAGLLALKLRLRRHAMYAAAALGLIGFLGSAGRGVPALLKSAAPPSIAVYTQLAMAVVCLVLIAACVRSFIETRWSTART